MVGNCDRYLREGLPEESLVQTKAIRILCTTQCVSHTESGTLCHTYFRIVFCRQTFCHQKNFCAHLAIRTAHVIRASGLLAHSRMNNELCTHSFTGGGLIKNLNIYDCIAHTVCSLRIPESEAFRSKVRVQRLSSSSCTISGHVDR